MEALKSREPRDVLRSMFPPRALEMGRTKLIGRKRAGTGTDTRPEKDALILPEA
jgi:hypothetical protein